MPAAGVGATSGKAIGESAKRLFATVPSLEKAKRALADALRDSRKRIIVIIDDLDRLLPSEMRAMFSLVKNLGDLPNILYVLSFDRGVVTKTLKSSTDSVEHEFLEKIIQVQLKLPPPWQSEIRNLFFQRINQIIEDITPNDQERWQRCFLDSISPYIQTPRDVSRFSNTLQVIWPNVSGDVDLADIVMLTILQLFDPPVYEKIFDNIEDLAGENISFESDKDLAARFDPVDAVLPATAKKALSHLFPQLAKGWNQNFWDGTPYIKKREQRRVCTKEYYRNYFLFGRDPDRVSRTEIEDLLTVPRPKEVLANLIERHSAAETRRGKSRVASLLDQILEIVFAKPLLSSAMVAAILDLSDELILRQDVVWEFFAEENLERLDSILTFGLAPLSEGMRSECLETLRQHGTGLTLAVVTVDRLAGHHGLYGSEARSESEQYTTRTIAIEAVADILQKIKKAANDGSLLKLPRPMRIIWAWRRFTNADEVKEWLTKEMKSDESILQLAKVLPNVSLRSSGKGQEEITSFKASTYEEILDAEYFKGRLEEVVSKNPRNKEYEKIRFDFLAAEALGSKERF